MAKTAKTNKRGYTMLTEKQAKELHAILSTYEKNGFALLPTAPKALNLWVVGKSKKNHVVCLAPGGMDVDQARKVSKWGMRGECKIIHNVADAENHIADIEGTQRDQIGDQFAALWDEADEKRIDRIGQNGNNGDHYPAET